MGEISSSEERIISAAHLLMLLILQRRVMAESFDTSTFSRCRHQRRKVKISSRCVWERKAARMILLSDCSAPVSLRCPFFRVYPKSICMNGELFFILVSLFCQINQTAGF